MSKYIFATKFKKIEKEPLYYNLQVSVDKTCSAADINALGDPGFHNIIFYEHSPIILTFVSENYWKFSSENFTMETKKPVTYTNLCLNSIPLIYICEGTYPLPETVSVVKNGVTVTFTPIPVYEIKPEAEPLYYNMQISVDKDVIAKTERTVGRKKHFIKILH
jgi:hypothetical protein